MSPEEIAARLLTLARDEGILGDDGIQELARGLRERAELLLAERVAPLEERVAGQERELEWRSGLQQAAEAKADWLEAELARTRESHGETARAHDRLLEHHHRLCLDVARRLEALGARLPRRAAVARTEVSSLVAALRAEADE